LNNLRLTIVAMVNNYVLNIMSVCLLPGKQNTHF